MLGRWPLLHRRLLVSRISQGRSPSSSSTVAPTQHLQSLRRHYSQQYRDDGQSPLDRVFAKDHKRLLELRMAFKRRSLLVKGFMIKRRQLTLPYPLTVFNGRSFFVYSVSDLCGHASFLFFTLTYLESEFLNLRIYAASGITLSIAFQYYRDQPLWIPIRWNGLFLLINFVMITMLLKELGDADHLPPEKRELYETFFKDFGMTGVDFLRLMNLADRRELRMGERVIGQGDRHHHMHLVKSGRLSVEVGSDRTRDIHRNQFVGAMSFLAWSKAESKAGDRNEEDTEGLANVVAVEPCVLYSWSFQELQALMQDNKRLGLAFEKCLSADISDKMAESITVRASKERLANYRHFLHGVLSSSDELSQRQREAVAAQVSACAIAPKEHAEALRACGWSLADWAAGARSGAEQSPPAAVPWWPGKYLLGYLRR